MGLGETPMLARLWWKELRAVWPLWVAVGLITLAVQALYSRYVMSSEQAHNGDLILFALTLTNLYAFATGAAAFAGERETKTLRLLDTLPVDRRTLWLGKATFALTTTFALALVLVVAAAIGTVWPGPFRRAPTDPPLLPVAIVLAVVLVESVAWGLLWSAALENVLLAATLAITCVGLMVWGSINLLDDWGTDRTATGLLKPLPLQLAVALGRWVCRGG